MKKPVREDMKLYPDAMKASLFFSIVLHAMVLLLFGAGMGLQGGSPGKVDVMYVSLVRESGPKSVILKSESRIQNSEVRIQNPESRSEEESFKIQPRLWRARRSTFNVEEVKSNVQDPRSKINSDTPQDIHYESWVSPDELTTNNFQLTTPDLEAGNSGPGTRDQGLANYPRPVAVTAYAGNSLPAGILGQGSEANAGLIYFPPVATTLPRPPYPLSSRRKGEEGTVTLSFLIYSDGTVGEILVVQSSGYPRLDKAASRSLRSAVFRPASESGLLVTSNRKIAFSFRLED
jgi:TonB family protein